MKQLSGLLVAMLLVGLMATVSDEVKAQGGGAEVRVVHASPDAPAVDVLVNGDVAFSGASFQDVTDYATLPGGTYNIQVVPAGSTAPVVIEADLDLVDGTDYTVVAANLLANIQPLVLVDNNALPAMGEAKVRFVHASPDAPAVDIAVKDGPVLFSNIAFTEVGNYVTVGAATYDLEVRVAGTNNVALDLPGINLASQTVYTVFAVGLLAGNPDLSALAVVDAESSMVAPPPPVAKPQPAPQPAPKRYYYKNYRPCYHPCGYYQQYQPRRSYSHPPKYQQHTYRQYHYRPHQYRSYYQAPRYNYYHQGYTPPYSYQPRYHAPRYHY